MPIQILPATADDYPTLANIQVVSFQNNPLNRLMFPKGNTPANQEVTIGTIQNQAKDSYTHFFKAVDTETGEIAGYSRWAFYLKERSEEEINAPVPKRPEHPEVNVELRNAMVEELEKSKKIVMGRRPHLSLNLLAVDPKFQRRGVGTTLVQQGFDIADKEGIETYLESTDDGYPLYLRLEFLNVDCDVCLDVGKWTGIEGDVLKFPVMVRQPLVSKTPAA